MQNQMRGQLRQICKDLIRTGSQKINLRANVSALIPHFDTQCMQMFTWSFLRFSNATPGWTGIFLPKT